MRQTWILMVILCGCASSKKEAVTEPSPLSPDESTYVAIPDMHGTPRALLAPEETSIYTSPWGVSEGLDMYEVPGRFQGMEDTSFGQWVQIGERALIVEHHQWDRPDPSFQITPQEFHPYRYAQNNPASIIDRSGMCETCETAYEYGSRAVDAVVSLSVVGRIQSFAEDAVHGYYDFKEPKVMVYRDPESGDVLGHSTKEAWSMSWEHSSASAKETWQQVTLQKAIENLPFTGAPPGGVKVNVSDKKLQKEMKYAEKSHKDAISTLTRRLGKGLMPRFRALGGNIFEIGLSKHGGPRVYFRLEKVDGKWTAEVIAASVKGNQHKVLTRLAELGYTQNDRRSVRRIVKSKL